MREVEMGAIVLQAPCHLSPSEYSLSLDHPWEEVVINAVCTRSRVFYAQSTRVPRSCGKAHVNDRHTGPTERVPSRKNTLPRIQTDWNGNSCEHCKV